ncbi:hypothetical protein ABT124_42945 [Streptomyces sp. NPDC001982]
MCLPCPLLGAGRPNAVDCKRVQQMLDQAAEMTEALGGRPRPYSVA